MVGSALTIEREIEDARSTRCDAPSKVRPGWRVRTESRMPLNCDALVGARCHFFSIYKLINFKLVHSYNVKHFTCNIFCSSGLQNIYKLHIWKCLTFTIFTLLTKEKKRLLHIQNILKSLMVGL